jgi:retron-type reverse transcriptase
LLNTGSFLRDAKADGK